MKVLVLNCGSSSLKYQLIDSETENVLAKGLCERIGIDGSAITHQPADGHQDPVQDCPGRPGQEGLYVTSWRQLWEKQENS